MSASVAAARRPAVPVPAPPPSRFSRAWWAAWLPRPTVLAAALLGVVVVATPLLVRPLGLLLAAAVVVLVAVDALLAPRPWRLGVARRLPPVVALGEEGTCAWTVSSPSRRPLRVWLADALPPSLGAGTRRVALAVPTGGRATATTVMRPWRRGTFRPDEVVLRVAGPLGLGTRQAPRSVPGELQVHPAFPSRDATLLRLELDRVRNAGNRIAPTLGGGTEFDHLREYRHGDDVRRVDWGATARLGHPVVRTYRVERDRTVQVLLEHGRAAATVVDGVPRLDHAMDAAMALLTAAGEVGDRAGLTAYAAGVTGVLAPARRADQVARAAAMLHDLEPELVEAAHRSAFAAVAARQRRRALLVLLTDIGAAAAMDALLHALPVLTTRHEVVVGSVDDPVLVTVADRVPHEALAAHGSAGAADVLARRTQNAALLEQRGARVVTAAPGVLAERLVDVYLDLKARGRL